ncbi:hypothetical protein [Balneatrix alpica]|uniref:hypothetical protein n=1 Tax=Balneatrix alpica TaxID=75684 RepID=UPI002738F8B9|nr:hypothetical protein [Balneatrix alpica]
MPVPARYHQPELIEMLAQGYVLGQQSLRVRHRVQRLRGQISALDDAIWQWELQLLPLAQQVAQPSQILPSARQQARFYRWQQQLQPGKATQATGEEPSVQSRKATSAQQGWRTLALAVCLAVVMLAVGWWQWPQQQMVTPHYLASMSDHQGRQQLLVSSTRFAPGQAHLQLHLADGQNWPETALELWADLGPEAAQRYVMLGKPSASNPDWPLDKARWLAVTQAQALLLVEVGQSVAEPANWLSRGPCWQLRPWQS